MSRDGGQRDVKRLYRNDPTMRRGRPLVRGAYDCLLCYNRGVAQITWQDYKPLSHRIERRVFKLQVIQQAMLELEQD